jgi:hypothetical protein
VLPMYLDDFVTYVPDCSTRTHFLRNLALPLIPLKVASCSEYVLKRLALNPRAAQR